MRKNEKYPIRAYALMTGILSNLVGSILVGIFSGRWLDQMLGTEPTLLIIGLLLGLATGVYATFRLVNYFFSGD
ncbi:AtpZ/AtpI family protein [Bacillus sinesaloumensis]|uniref:AtpZ/AtpI family protein n=1 Tax=Litchfieldia sinesaloumensis TaxID=1926280 RepID=UPI0009883AAF|nr:AtpZ/AtpI family protein [Bacillus sinesaloumensis]